MRHNQQKWEQWRNNEQKRYQKQQSWSPNGYWETYTMKRTIQEFVILDVQVFIYCRGIDFK